MDISLKPGVKIDGLRPEIVLGLMCVKAVFDRYKYELVITEGTGGKHMVGSLHYKGLALDIRSKHISDAVTKAKILFDCQDALGENFDFILEGDTKVNEHFHLEFDPE
jgi:hypothetical protein